MVRLLEAMGIHGPDIAFLRLGNNLAGQHKRAIGMAVHLGVGNMNGIIASNLYLSTEAPRYILGRTSIPLLFRRASDDSALCAASSR